MPKLFLILLILFLLIPLLVLGQESAIENKKDDSLVGKIRYKLDKPVKIFMFNASLRIIIGFILAVIGSILLITIIVTNFTPSLILLVIIGILYILLKVI